MPTSTTLFDSAPKITNASLSNITMTIQSCIYQHPYVEAIAGIQVDTIIQNSYAKNHIMLNIYIWLSVVKNILSKSVYP